MLAELVSYSTTDPPGDLADRDPLEESAETGRVHRRHGGIEGVGAPLLAPRYKVEGKTDHVAQPLDPSNGAEDVAYMLDDRLPDPEDEQLADLLEQLLETLRAAMTVLLPPHVKRRFCNTKLSAHVLHRRPLLRQLQGICDLFLGKSRALHRPLLCLTRADSDASLVQF